MQRFNKAFMRKMAQAKRLKSNNFSAYKLRNAKLSFKDALKNIAQLSQNQLGMISQLGALAQDFPQYQLSLAKDIKLNNVPNIKQTHNACGPFSLAMALEAAGINISNPDNLCGGSHTVGHGPLALKREAVARGATVRQMSNASLNDIVAWIDRGMPVVALGINGGGSNSTISNYISNLSKGHWVTVTGYKKDDTGKITHMYVNNPASGSTQLWTASYFEKFWQNNVIPGGHRYCMVMAKKGTFQETLIKKFLKTDKISWIFKIRLQIVDGLEKTFYESEEAALAAVNAVENAAEEVADFVEDAANEVADFVEDAADTVADAFEDAGEEIADAAEDAWDTVSGWFS